ncbi:uncharacterized protein PRD47_000340 [Ara ararauna]
MAERREELAAQPPGPGRRHPGNAAGRSLLRREPLTCWRCVVLVPAAGAASRSCSGATSLAPAGGVTGRWCRPGGLVGKELSFTTAFLGAAFCMAEGNSSAHSPSRSPLQRSALKRLPSAAKAAQEPLRRLKVDVPGTGPCFITERFRESEGGDFRTPPYRSVRTSSRRGEPRPAPSEEFAGLIFYSEVLLLFHALS